MAVVIGLTVPSLATGLALDDLLHRAFVERHQAGLLPNAPAWDMFRVTGGDPGAVAEAIQHGLVPWWTHPELRLGFFRPLAGTSHYLDYSLWPDATWWMHLQNVGWYLALVALWMRVARRLVVSDLWVPVLAGLLFAIDEAHAPVVGWIAQRNALLAAVFGLASLWAHLRWRDERWRPGLPVSLFALMLALASSEAAIAMWGYFLAHAIIAERGGWRRRVGGLLPSVVLLVVYRVLYDHMGYGAYGAGAYVDPGREPLTFLSAVGERLPVLWSALVAPVSADGAAGDDRVLALGALVTIVLTAVSWPRLVRDRWARMMVLGSVLALVPACAVVPGDRMLLIPGLGLSLWLAQILRDIWPPRFRGARGIASAVVLVAVVGIHVITAAVRFPGRTEQMQRDLDRRQRQVVEATQRALLQGPGDLVLVNTPSYYFGLYRGREPEDRVLVLGATPKAVVLGRPAVDQLVLQPVDGFFRDPVSALLRGRDHPFHVGDAAQLPGVKVEVRRVTADGHPRDVLYTFDRSVDELRLVAWQDGELVKVPLPPLHGWHVILPGRFAPQA